MTTEELYRKALNAAGYDHAPATAEAVTECWKDYADAGYWSNVSADDAANYSAEVMARGLLRSCR